MYYRGQNKKVYGLHPGHGTLKEKASDRGVPFSVSMRHAFVPFPGKRLLVAIGLLIGTGKSLNYE